ncbi:hypothetical protein B0J13DRAFT_132604 [Dactylonectria estremocensis]|uniref:Reverse transcriptase domain-containing protein n=1 Tax=Dactylonectria estremocensis TaxID=1079267 RepID=A0A9P9E318_9HYPO|nr:hypothetical protein B0J13DRAFT_132604 [Dactylonectria estremocensis]
MATSGSVFSDTLQEITNTKLDELSKRRSRFELEKSTLLDSIRDEVDGVKRLGTLSSGVKQCFAITLDKTGKVITNQTKHVRLETELKNLDRFLGQARCDPSISAKMLDRWEQSLRSHLNTQSLKFQYASLYGQLVTEWLSGDKEEETAAGDDVEMGETFENVGDAAKLESRMEWEKMVFETPNVNEAALARYLDHLFGAGDEEKKPILSALEKLREEVSNFEAQMALPNQFDIYSLRWVIRGLHSSDLLSDEKREVLKDFESNTIILNEIADVLNMRMSALRSWAWCSDTPVMVEMRRKISGIYNIHMHEDLLQAIFLQYIGVKWSVFFKRVFKEFRRSKDAWKSPRKDIPKAAKQRLGYYLGPLSRSPCLQGSRARINFKKYFMAQLLNDENQSTDTADGEVEAEYEQVAVASLKRKSSGSGKLASRATLGAKRHRKIANPAVMKAIAYGGDDDDNDTDDGDEDDDDNHNPMVLKQELLHLLSTEITINKRLYGEMTAFHSVFESWDPLLPHATICIVLKYLGVSETWLAFFARFLRAPLKFVDDDKSAPTRTRRRGTPASHILSDMFGETTLFCLDFAVNQSTSGSPLWRIHDDVWFWSRDHGVAVQAWKTVGEFAKVTGTEINAAKTGTVRVSNNANETLTIDETLPVGEIRWGFLHLSPQSGRFEIDQVMVDAHIDELHKQLHDKPKSIFSFIQAWNTYAATFFTSNFGKAANCFGREHVDNMLATHERIQRDVFSRLPGEGGEKVTSIAEYLKKALRQRFGIEDVPDGYLYFPMELGGLDLQSPFISLLQIRDEVPKSPSDLLDALEQAEHDAYECSRTEFLNGNTRDQRYALDDPDWEPESAQDRSTFMSFSEYTLYREEFSFEHYSDGTRLHDVFRALMKRPSDASIDPDDSTIWTAHNQLAGQASLRGITGHWHGMEPYWRWAAMMYGPEIVDRFGGLNIVDPGLLPMGMVKMFRDKRVKWQG